MTSINERQYQLPFCQVLAAEGETILYISSHGPLEKGKDVITRTADGEIRAYQLKANNIRLPEWRSIRGEIVDLVELPIEHPSTGVVTKFTPYLVTNGSVSDPVLEQVRASNVGWQARGIPNQLRVIQQGELLDRFRRSHGAYLPRELTDFRMFLELFLRNGTFVAEKSKAAQLLEGVLSSVSGKKASSLEVARAASSAVLLTAYVTHAAQERNNHWAIFEYWILAAAYILRLAEEYGTTETHWGASFNICELSAERAIESLIAECETSGHLVQGDPLVDASVYSSRMTVLTGLFASYAIRNRMLERDCPQSEFILQFIEKNLRNAVLWGESAVPFLAIVSLELFCRCRHISSEGLLIQLVGEIAAQNGSAATGRGLPNVYYSPEESIRINSGLDFLNHETFVGHTYCIETLIDILARRWRRQAIGRLWYSITRMQLATYVPATAAEWYRWDSSHGTLETAQAKEPQSWAELLCEAENLSCEGLPTLLAERPQFAVWYMLVYPHRFSRRLMKLIETSVLPEFWNLSSDASSPGNQSTPFAASISRKAIKTLQK